jgi:hypothetical protein
MRLKTYYMPEEITTNLYTTGGTFQTEDGVEYKGAYHRYSTGEVYTGPIWNRKTSKRLVRLETTLPRDVTYSKLKPRLQTKFITPQPARRTPTVDEYKVGYFERYFLKKCNDLTFLEIDDVQYKLWSTRRIDPVAFNAVTFRWFISGNIEDTQSTTSSQPGVLTKNNIQIQYAQQQLPGIISVLTDPLQYYADAEYSVPRDINN